MIIDVLISIFAFILVISIVVFIHELGHYLIAKISGVKIEAFSIGFGKEIFGWTDKSETRWSVRMLPFGGYVQMFGDGDASSSSKNLKLLNSMSEEDKKKSLQFKPPLVKAGVAFAGPLFNFLLAIAILIPFYSIKGTVITKPIITEIIKNTPAEKYGFKINDEILEIDGNEIDTFEEVQTQIALNVKDLMDFKIKRDNEIISIQVPPITKQTKDVFGNDIRINFIGIGSGKVEYKKISILQSIPESFKNVYDMCKSSLISIGQIITGRRGLDGLGGPIKIAKYSGQYFKSGFAEICLFIVMISVSLGLMNLLPIPVLDGGLILICLLEFIFRKPLPEKVEKYISMCGYIVLIFLMILTTLKDTKDVIFR